MRGWLKDLKAFDKEATSFSTRRPAQECSVLNIAPYVDDWALWDVPNASNTYTSQRSAIFLEKFLSLSFSPTKHLIFSNIVIGESKL